jgi:D-amino-acid oxidase
LLGVARDGVEIAVVVQDLQTPGPRDIRLSFSYALRQRARTVVNHGLVRVTVLGAGVVGLTTAVSLLDAGCEVRVVTAAPAEGTTSYVAAAVWFPTHVGPPDRVAGWGRRTLEVLAGQARDRVPGVIMRESLALYREPPGRPDWAESVGEVRAAATAELPPGYSYGLRFAVPLVEMPVYLPWLAGQVRDRGGEISLRRVSSLGELSDGWADAVVNCPGLGARELVGDLSVYPVRGQIVRVTNPGLSLSVRDEYHPAGRAYVHPRTSDCILGGTLDEHQWDTEVDLATAEAIIARCTSIVPGLADAEILGHVVGLRPGRPEVRLEEDLADAAGVRIVHNYGHGGAGITLSWGCAEHVTRILLPG